MTALPEQQEENPERSSIPTGSGHAANERASGSVFARVAAIVYMLLIVYASLHPFSGWHDNGMPPFSYARAPLPHYWTGFDLFANILAYIPLGILIVFALYPALRGFWAVLPAILLGGLLSAGIEATQTFLPSRVPSNLDWMTNFAGACIGALIGAALSRVFLVQSRLLRLREKWFSRQASRGLIVAGLWPLAQIYPQSYLFGHGQIVPTVSSWLTEWLDTPVDLAGLLLPDTNLTVEQYWLSETIITACGLSGALLTMLCLLRPKAPKTVLVLLLAGAALAVKSLASALLFAPENAFAWLTPAALGGLVIGSLMLCGLAFAPPLAQRRVAALTLIVGLLAVNIAPANPYFLATLQEWVQGKFLNFYGAAQFLSILWPFLSLWFLYHPVHRLKQS